MGKVPVGQPPTAIGETNRGTILSGPVSKLQVRRVFAEKPEGAMLRLAQGATSNTTTA